MAAASKFTPDLNKNEAEYRGLLLTFDLIDGQTRGRVTIHGDSNYGSAKYEEKSTVRGPGLQLLRHRAVEKLRSWPDHEFLHMRRD